MSERLTEGSHVCTFSPDRSYRYRLTAFLKGMDDSKIVNFIMLNPSTADEQSLDPTLRRCATFAKDWGYGHMVITNLFAYRATDPKEMKSAKEPVGLLNDATIELEAQQADTVICAWGAHGNYRNRSSEVIEMLCSNRTVFRHKLHYLALTKDGTPRHPLYLKKDLVPLSFIDLLE